MKCRKCGTELKKGNIQIIREKGKRPVRECRRCPNEAGLKTNEREEKPNKAIKANESGHSETNESGTKLEGIAPKRKGKSLTAVAGFVGKSPPGYASKRVPSPLWMQDGGDE